MRRKIKYKQEKLIVKKNEHNMLIRIVVDRTTDGRC